MIHNLKEGNHKNFIIIFISFICYTIVFVLYVLQEKIWHIVMSGSVMRACGGGGVFYPTFSSLPVLEKVHSEDKFYLFADALVSLSLYFIYTAGLTGAG